MTLLSFSLQQLIRRVLLCGSCHFTHGYVKPVGGSSQAAVHVSVSMHNCAVKYRSVLSFYHQLFGSRQCHSLIVIFQPHPLPPLKKISVVWLYVAQCGLQIREANFIWTHDRANPSQLQNEKAVWSESIPEA